MSNRLKTLRGKIFNYILEKKYEVGFRIFGTTGGKRNETVLGGPTKHVSNDTFCSSIRVELAYSLYPGALSDWFNKKPNTKPSDQVANIVHQYLNLKANGLSISIWDAEYFEDAEARIDLAFEGGVLSSIRSLKLTNSIFQIGASSAQSVTLGFLPKGPAENIAVAPNWDVARVLSNKYSRTVLNMPFDGFARIIVQDQENGEWVYYQANNLSFGQTDKFPSGCLINENGLAFIYQDDCPSNLVLCFVQDRPFSEKWPDSTVDATSDSKLAAISASRFLALFDEFCENMGDKNQYLAATNVYIEPQ